MMPQPASVVKHTTKFENKENLPSSELVKSLEPISVLPPVIPYHFTLSTGVDRDASTTARVYIIIIGPQDVETDRLWLDLAEGKKSFTAGTMEHFVCYGTDVGEIKRVEVRIWD